MTTAPMSTAAVTGTTIGRSTEMYTLHESLAREHRPRMGVRRRWRGQTEPRDQMSRELERAHAARLAMARLLYGGQPR